jgi:hypothetical protein
MEGIQMHFGDLWPASSQRTFHLFDVSPRNIGDLWAGFPIL